MFLNSRLILFTLLISLKIFNVITIYNTSCRHLVENNLSKVYCNNMNLKSITKVYFENIDFFDASNNSIESITDPGLASLRNISVLILRDNCMTPISLKQIKGFVILQILDLSYNRLHYIPENIIENNVQLKKLYLEGNLLLNLDPQPFLNSNSLEVLNITNCSIHSLYIETFSKLPALKHLDISNNNITNLNKGIIQYLTNLRCLYFKGNEQIHNDEVYQLYEFLFDKQIKLKCGKTLIAENDRTDDEKQQNMIFEKTIIAEDDQTDDEKQKKIHENMVGSMCPSWITIMSINIVSIVIVIVLLIGFIKYRCIRHKSRPNSRELSSLVMQNSDPDRIKNVS